MADWKLAAYHLSETLRHLVTSGDADHDNDRPALILSDINAAAEAVAGADPEEHVDDIKENIATAREWIAETYPS